MRKKGQYAGATANTTAIDQASSRIELAKTLREQSRTRIELAKTRREQVKTRRELAKTRTEQIKTRVELATMRRKKPELRTEQVAKTLQRVVHKEFDMQQKISPPRSKQFPMNEFAIQKRPLERLTNRQREILRLIVESQNTKQIAGILKVSSKTVEYHRRKLMVALNVHDIPGLVRFAVRAGLVLP